MESTILFMDVTTKELWGLPLYFTQVTQAWSSLGIPPVFPLVGTGSFLKCGIGPYATTAAIGGSLALGGDPQRSTTSVWRRLNSGDKPDDNWQIDHSRIKAQWGTQKGVPLRDVQLLVTNATKKTQELGFAHRMLFMAQVEGESAGCGVRHVNKQHGRPPCERPASWRTIRFTYTLTW